MIEIPALFIPLIIVTILWTIVGITYFLREDWHIPVMILAVLLSYGTVCLYLIIGIIHLVKHIKIV